MFIETTPLFQGNDDKRPIDFIFNQYHYLFTWATVIFSLPTVF